MINIKMIGDGVCDNCKRLMPFILERTIVNSKFKLCEDCSNALGYLHILCMKNGNSYAYEKDDFVKED